MTFAIRANEALRRSAMPLVMKNPRTVGQKLAKYNGVSLSSIIMDFGGTEYMKANGALTPLGRDRFAVMKADCCLPKKSSTEEYVKRKKEIFSALTNAFSSERKQGALMRTLRPPVGSFIG